MFCNGLETSSYDRSLQWEKHNFKSIQRRMWAFIRCEQCYIPPTSSRQKKKKKKKKKVWLHWKLPNERMKAFSKYWNLNPFKSVNPNWPICLPHWVGLWRYKGFNTYFIDILYYYFSTKHTIKPLSSQMSPI